MSWTKSDWLKEKKKNRFDLRTSRPAEYRCRVWVLGVISISKQKKKKKKKKGGFFVPARGLSKNMIFTVGAAVCGSAGRESGFSPQARKVK